MPEFSLCPAASLCSPWTCREQIQHETDLPMSCVYLLPALCAEMLRQFPFVLPQTHTARRPLSRVLWGHGGVHEALSPQTLQTPWCTRQRHKMGLIQEKLPGTEQTAQIRCSQMLEGGTHSSVGMDQGRLRGGTGIWALKDAYVLSTGWW